MRGYLFKEGLRRPICYERVDATRVDHDNYFLMFTTLSLKISFISLFLSRTANSLKRSKAISDEVSPGCVPDWRCEHGDAWMCRGCSPVRSPSQGRGRPPASSLDQASDTTQTCPFLLIAMSLSQDNIILISTSASR